MNVFTSSNLLQTPHENETASKHFCWWKPARVKTSVIPVMLGGHSGLDPPLPISNRAVKRTSANDSMLLACESRSLPSYLYLNTPPCIWWGVFICGAAFTERTLPNNACFHSLTFKPEWRAVRCARAAEKNPATVRGNRIWFVEFVKYLYETNVI